MNNPTDKVKFNEVKKGLTDLSGIKGIIPAFFYLLASHILSIHCF